MVRQRIQLHFSKQDNLCFIGHRDLLRTMDRLFCRARLPLAMSEGFHPKPRISYLSALSLGFTGKDEVMEIILEQETNPAELLALLNSHCPDGLLFTEARVMIQGEGKGKAASFDYRMTIPAVSVSETKEKISEMLQADSLPVVKPNGKTVDLRPQLLSLSLDESLSEGNVPRLCVTLAIAQGPEATIREVLVCLGLEKELFKTIFPERTKTNLA